MAEIAIHLHDEHYARLVIGVDDPAGAAGEIARAVSSEVPYIYVTPLRMAVAAPAARMKRNYSRGRRSARADRFVGNGCRERQVRSLPSASGTLRSEDRAETWHKQRGWSIRNS